MFEHESKDQERAANKNYWKQALVVLLTIICIAILTVACIVFVHRGNARRILKEAKLMQLAVRTVGAEYYAENKSIFDAKAVDGLTEGVSEELTKLTGVSGQLYLISWDSENVYPLHFVYIENGFFVDYVYAGGKDIWNVYEISQVIKH